MTYRIITIDDTNQLIIEQADNATNQLHLPDLRDLLLLRARINQYLETLTPDETIDEPPPIPTEMISANQARAEAEAQGITVTEAALRMAIVRGTIPRAEKRGGRWWLSRQDFEDWLQGHIYRK